MRIFVAAIILGLLMSAANAQKKDPAPLQESPPQKVDEKAYRDAINRIPDQKFDPDPWGTVRDTGAVKGNKNKKPVAPPVSAPNKSN